MFLIPIIMFIAQPLIVFFLIYKFISAIKKANKNPQNSSFPRTTESFNKFKNQSLNNISFNSSEDIAQESLDTFISGVKKLFNIDEDAEVIIKKDIIENKEFEDHLGGSATSEPGSHAEAHLEKQVLTVEDSPREYLNESYIKEVELPKVHSKKKSLLPENSNMNMRQAFMVTEILKEPKCRNRKRAAN